MTVLSAQSLRNSSIQLMVDGRLQARRIVEPFVERTQHQQTGTSYGLSSCGYDVRLDQDIYIHPGEFKLGSTLEHFYMPDFWVGIVHDKSTWARRGIAVQNTVIEPGWRGYLTLELTNHGEGAVYLPTGTPIAQVLFHALDRPTQQPYPDDGKYQNQARGPQEAR